MDPSFSHLIEAYLTDSLTIEQEIAFIKMLEDPEYRNILDKTIEEKTEDQSLKKVLNDGRMEANLLRLKEKLHHINDDADIKPVHRLHYLRHWKWVAASVIFLLLTGTATWISKQSKVSNNNNGTSSAVAIKHDVLPGQDGAILTLGDGSIITLDSLNNGLIANQNGTKVILQNSQLAYTPTGESVDKQTWNTMSTPNGRQFRLVLPDGSKVWLNAASSIRYPTTFNGSERKVEVTGEVYFEVARNEMQPFKVSINNGAEVMVLGTHFNINAYNDEPAIKTTLLEGSVRISKADSSVILQPGQQGVITQDIHVNKKVDVQQAVSWKNGAFNFNDVTIQELMRQLSRWYDVRIIYEGEVKNEKFAGQMGRDLHLNEVLTVLKDVGVNAELDGNTVIVYGSSQP